MQSPFGISFLSTVNEISLPTIISAIFSTETSLTLTVPITLPRLRTVQLSATALISFNLCVMTTMVLPSLAKPFMMLINS